MGTRHTPGPWSVVETRSSQVRIVVTGADVDVCKHDARAGRVQDEARANARLIAAAPELLHALETALPVLAATQRLMAAEAARHGMEPDDKLLNSMRAAIAKATQP